MKFYVVTPNLVCFKDSSKLSYELRSSEVNDFENWISLIEKDDRQTEIWIKQGPKDMFKHRPLFSNETY